MGADCGEIRLVKDIGAWDWFKHYIMFMGWAINSDLQPDSALQSHTSRDPSRHSAVSHPPPSLGPVATETWAVFKKLSRICNLQLKMDRGG